MTSTTASTLDESINRQTHSTIGWLMTRQTFWVFVAAVLAIAYLSIATDTFFTAANLFNVARNFAFVGIIGLGMTAVIITGGIDLSVGALLCLTGMVTGMMMANEYSIWIAMPAGIVASIVTGGVTGILIAYVGMPPFVVTLGMMSLARSLAMVLSNNQLVYHFGHDNDKLVAFGGGSTRGWFNGLANWAGPDSTLGTAAHWLAAHINVPNPAVFLIVLAFIFGFAFRWTRWGRYIFAIGGNEHAATLTGVPVRRIKVSVYVISAMMGGIAGLLEVGWLGTITTGLGTGMELIVIAAVVIGGTNLAGGTGTAFGAVVGAALIEVIRNSLTLLGINPFWQGTFVGTFIIIAVLFERVKNLRQRA
jgi:ribose transport system permease protein